MKITELLISNWKSFPFNNSPDPIRFHDNLNIFIGPNSSGKTNLANALRMVCGYGPDYGGDEDLRANEEIRKTDFNQIINNEPIEIKVRTDEQNDLVSLRIEQKDVPYSFNYPKLSFFPIGTERELHKLTSATDHKQEFNNIWDQLRTDVRNHFKFELSETKPQLSGELFSDLYDMNGQTLYEAGRGYASLVYFLIELSIHRQVGVKCFLFEEPEITMHPSLLRQLTIYLIEQKDIQFFITTHSSLFIDETLRSGGSIFQLHKNDNDQSVVTNIKSNKPKLRNLIYEQLGNSPGDILLAKSVIWVEGPSDVIYLKHWLRTKGLLENEYTFMFYGGSLVSHVSFENINVDYLIELCDLNPNSMIIIDRDRDNGTEKLKSNTQKAYDNFQENNKLAWITGGREIENYIHPEVLQKAVKKIHPDTEFIFKTGQFETMVKPKNKTNKFSKTEVAKEVARIYETDLYEYDLWDLDQMLTRLVTEIKKSW